MALLTDEQLGTLATRFAESLRTEAPDWTTPPADDPGVALLQVFAFVAEALRYRSTSLPDGADRQIARIAAALAGLRQSSASMPATLTRVRFFSGKLLTADDLQLEQDYVRGKHRRLNLILLGAGVVSGLRVEVDPASSDSAPVVSIGPGAAIAPNGEELVFPAAVVCTLQASSSSGFVTLRYRERPVDPAPATNRPEGEATRIEEGTRIDFDTEVSSDGVVIACLTRDTGGWRVDLPSTFPAIPL